MSMRHALQTILAISLAGLVFSGVLSYRELFGGAPACSTAAGGTGLLLGIPTCVYGFVMYALVAVVSSLGLLGERRRSHLTEQAAG